MIIRIAIAFLFLVLAKDVLADKQKNIAAELEPAFKTMASGDYPKAYAQLSRFADKNPLAQFNLGLIHKNGLGDLAVDEVKACQWFEKSAHGNIPAGQHFYGDCLAQGINQPVDYPAAIEWYKKAAAGGHLISLCSAGDIYIKGKGVEKDAAQGLALCTQAAQGYSPPAMLKLANYYREGTDIGQDLAAARYWYQEAAERNTVEAQYHLGVMLSEGQGGPVDLNKALTLLETAAAEGYAPAYLPTAILYANAEVDPKTGALAPEHLAKVYMWINAAKAQPINIVRLAEISRIEEMVLSVMPVSWRADLDKKVAEHLAKYKS